MHIVWNVCEHGRRVVSVPWHVCASRFGHVSRHIMHTSPSSVAISHARLTVMR